ncbi:hypothetical protein GKODMF_12395 [Candidatus Electrothrix gigas]
MRPFYTALFVVLIVIAFDFCAGQKCEAQPQEENVKEIVIGFNYPKTGPYKQEGKDQFQGAELARKQINDRGGILGRTITWGSEPQDTQSDPEKAKENACDLLVNKKAKMIFGGSSSGVAVEVGKVASYHKRLFFATLTYSMDTTGKDGYKTTFRECSDSWMAAKALGHYLKDNKLSPSLKKKYFYITAGYTWGYTTETALRFHTNTTDTAIHEGVITPFKGGFKNRIATGKDFSDALKKAIHKNPDENPDVLVLVLFGNDFIKAIRVIKEKEKKFKNKRPQIIVPNLTYAMARSAGADNMKGIIGTVPWEWQVARKEEFSKGKIFVTEYQRANHGAYPSSSAASAYNILYQYKEAVERLYDIYQGNSHDEKKEKEYDQEVVTKVFDDTEGLIDQLENAKYTGVKDEQQWRDFDHQSLQSVFVVQGKKKPENANDYFQILNKYDKVAIPKILWIWQRLMAGKKELGWYDKDSGDPCEGYKKKEIKEYE